MSPSIVLAGGALLLAFASFAIAVSTRRHTDQRSAKATTDSATLFDHWTDLRDRVDLLTSEQVAAEGRARARATQLEASFFDAEETLTGVRAEVAGAVAHLDEQVAELVKRLASVETSFPEALALEREEASTHRIELIEELARLFDGHAQLLRADLAARVADVLAHGSS